MYYLRYEDLVESPFNVLKETLKFCLGEEVEGHEILGKLERELADMKKI